MQNPSTTPKKSIQEDQRTSSGTAQDDKEQNPDEKQELRFTDIVNGLQNVYPKQQMADISTSYCFICLLHLANEKGLVIENQDGFQDLSISRDFAAEITGGGD